jgi:glycolate oxidase iron-sulfur subunit
MQTNFSPAQLAEPEIQDANAILRSCVHCGYCLATCPTYVLLGDELDSPRGRIYLAKQMLEGDETPSPEVVKHLDRCLTCLSCLSTCPSSVNYEHLIHHARSHIERRFKRPLPDRLLRRMLGRMLPEPRLFRLGLIAGAAARPLQRFMPRPLRAMLASLPERLPSPRR